MDPQTPNPQNQNSEGVRQEVPGVPTVDPATGEVSSQPINLEPTPTVSPTPVPSEPVAVIAESAAPTSVPMPLNTVETPLAQPSVIMGSTVAPAVKHTRRWLLPMAAVGTGALLLAAGYVFAFYLPNQPGYVYGTSLKRSSAAVDALANYTSGVIDKGYKSFAFDGKLKATLSGMSMDATVDGSMDEDANATTTVNADIMGEKMEADLRSLHVDGNKNPDVYLRVSGVKSLLDSYGLSNLSSLDGQWIAIDHTLMDSVSSKAGADASLATGSMPTSAQIQDALMKVQTVNKQYIFTTNRSTAVLKQSKYIGKETKDSRPVYHYKVGFDKTHLESYVTALGKQLDDSKLNDWSKANNDGKSLSEAMDIRSLEDSAKNAKADYTFDMWVDTKTKLVHELRFADPNDASTTFALAQNYTGGDDYPFQMTVSGKEGDQTVTVDTKININKKTDKTIGEFSLTGSDTTASFNFNVTPSDKKIDVAAPTGAKPVADIIGQLGLGTASTSSLDSSASTSTLDGLMLQ